MSETDPPADVPEGVAALFARYRAAVEAADEHAWAACWSDIAPRWVIAREGRIRSFEGKKAIVSAWSERMALFARVDFEYEIGRLHFVEANRAKIISRTKELLLGIDGVVTRSSGRYEDVVTRAGSLWLFAERNFTPAQRDGA